MTAAGTTGNITVTNGGVLDYTASKYAPTIKVAGNVTVDGGTVNLGQGTLQISGAYNQNSGTLNLAPGANLRPTTLGTAGTINSQSGSIMAGGAWTVLGNTVLNASGATNRFYVGTSTAQTWAGTVQINGWDGNNYNRMMTGNNNMQTNLHHLWQYESNGNDTVGGLTVRMNLLKVEHKTNHRWIRDLLLALVGLGSGHLKSQRQALASSNQPGISAGQLLSNDTCAELRLGA